MLDKRGPEEKFSSESYVVRLYRHQDSVGDALVGYVEDPHHDKQWPFRGLAELTAIFVGLTAQRRGGPKRPTKPR